MNLERKLKKISKIILFFSLFVIPTVVFASSKPESRSSDETTRLSLPIIQEKTIFSAIVDKSILGDIEIGSPSSIRRAISKLQQNPLKASEPEKVLLTVATEMLRIVYPAERITWDIPETKPGNAYTEIINSVKMGVYEFSPATNDYFSRILPSLVMFTTPAVTGYYAEAEVALTEAVALQPNSVIAPYMLATLYARQQKNDLALQMYQKAYNADTNCMQVAIAYAQSMVTEKKYNDAYVMGEQLLLQYPNNQEVIKLYAQTAFALEDWETADQFVAQVLQNSPNNQYYLMLRIRILLEQKEYVRASSLFDVYSRIDKTSIDYYLVRARLQRDWNKNIQAAAATIEEILPLYPDNEELLLLAADLASQTGQTIAGMTGAALAEKIIEKDPKNVQALYILVSDATRQKDWANAYEQVNVLRALVNDEKVNLLYIEASLGINDVDEALDIAKRLYDNNPIDEDVQYAYIKSLIAKGSTQEALSLIDLLLPSATLSMKSNLFYQQSLLASSDENRLSFLRSSLTTNPRNQNSLFDLYRYYYEKSDYRKAQYYLKQVTSINPADQNLLELQAELDNLLAR